MTDALRHHGDLDALPGLVDLAVNVRAGTPPQWLAEQLSGVDLARYPNQDAAVKAVAERHRRSPDEVLLTAGAAEAFVLIARALRPRLSVVIHPQFTEPEIALRGPATTYTDWSCHHHSPSTRTWFRWTPTWSCSATPPTPPQCFTTGRPSAP